MSYFRCSGKVYAAIHLLALLVLALLDPDVRLENEALLTLLNTLFIGVVPLLVAVVAGYAYLQKYNVSVLLMSCGMLAVGLGAVIGGPLRFFPLPQNVSVTLYNSCALYGAVFHLAASLMERSPKPEKADTRKKRLIMALPGTCLFVIAVFAASLYGWIPAFIDQNGSTRIRDIVLWLSTAFYFSAFIEMSRQWKKGKPVYIYWYSLSLLMISAGLLGVYLAAGEESLLGWVGRGAQYAAALFALFSMVSALLKARRQGDPLAEIMDEFFASDQDNYKNLAELSAGAVITVDENFHIFFANSSAASMFRFGENEMIHTSFLPLLPEPYKGRIRQDFLDIIDLGENRLFNPVEMEAVDREGRRFPVEISASYRTISSGHVCIYVIKDITERRRAEEALHRKESLLQAILEGTDNPIFLKDTASRILMGNRALSLAMGKPLADIIGKTDLEVYSDHDKAMQLMANDRQVLSSLEHRYIEEVVPTPEGTRTYLTAKTPWFDENGNTLGIIGIAQDITGRKATETELKRKTLELEEKNRLITDFFINISHEFKTPLSIIVLLADLLEREIGDMASPNEDYDRFVKMLRVNAYRLRRLVANLLDITKLDAGFMEPQWERVDVVALLKSVVTSADAYARQKGLALSFSCAAERLCMSTDSLMLERILMNLLSNAMKHTPAGGAIKVELGVPNGKVAITVTDNGEGISDEKKGIIFDRFRQVNTSLARTSEGCGIGLSISRALAELLGGGISFQSELGAGSAFTLTLPVLYVSDAGYTADFSGMGLESRIQMELSDIDFG